jgi:hypothetical protein
MDLAIMGTHTPLCLLLSTRRQRSKPLIGALARDLNLQVQVALSALGHLSPHPFQAEFAPC